MIPFKIEQNEINDFLQDDINYIKLISDELKYLYSKIPHYSKLEERFTYMNEQRKRIMNNKNIIYNIEFITAYDQEKITNELKDKYIKNDSKEWIRRLNIQMQKKEDSLDLELYYRHKLCKT